ncbi:unnamed protein product, partial [Protopolystoma xenopodis]
MDDVKNAILPYHAVSMHQEDIDNAAKKEKNPVIKRNKTIPAKRAKRTDPNSSDNGSCALDISNTKCLVSSSSRRKLVSVIKPDEEEPTVLQPTLKKPIKINIRNNVANSAKKASFNREGSSSSSDSHPSMKQCSSVEDVSEPLLMPRKGLMEILLEESALFSGSRKPSSESGHVGLFGSNRSRDTLSSDLRDVELRPFSYPSTPSLSPICQDQSVLDSEEPSVTSSERPVRPASNSFA